MATELSYEVATQQVRLRVTNALGFLWGALPSYRSADVDRFIARAVPLVRAGQLQVATLTAAYLRDQLGVFVPVEAAYVTGGRGVPADEVYRRPAVAAYTALSKGGGLSDAIAAGGKRLQSLASMDMQMSKVRQAARSTEAGSVSGFRRVLTGREDCALCVIASTQRYNKGDLMPIHPGCDCGVAPWRGGDEQVIDEALLASTRAAVESKLGSTDRGARDLGLGKTDAKGNDISDFTDLIVAREHGEYGPTLSWRMDAFTSKADIPAL